METWLKLILYTLCLPALLTFLFQILSSSQHRGKKNKLPLPPGPIPILGMLRFLGKSFPEIEALCRSMFSKYGPIVTLPFPTTSILISSGIIAHEALVQDSASFANKIKPGTIGKIASSNQHTVSSAAYGPIWRLLRRNMATFLHPSRYKLYSHVRQQLLHTVVNRLKADADSSCVGNGKGLVQVFEHFQFLIFSLLAFMCYGELLGEKSISKFEKTIRQMMQAEGRLGMLDLLPLLGKTLLRHRLNEYLEMRKELKMLILPYIEERIKATNSQQTLKGEKNDSDGNAVPIYVDTLLELKVEGDGGKRTLTQDELVNLCNEFVVAGSDTTSTVLQWTMANVVKYPAVQERILKEIKDILGEAVEEVKEEDLPKLNYLRAVVLEGLRRHPAGHFINQRLVTEDVELGGYTVPKGSIVYFMLSEMGWDPKLWQEPMKFRPERFLTNKIGGSEEEEEEAFDITCSREIKMMPFGAGRRICPGYALALLHLEYFVANLVLKFHWESVEGDDIDLAEKHVGPFVFMKHPLRARISPRA